MKQGNGAKFLSKYFAKIYKKQKHLLESTLKDEVNFILTNIWSMSKSEQYYAVTVLFRLKKLISKN